MKLFDSARTRELSRVRRRFRSTYPLVLLAAGLSCGEAQTNFQRLRSFGDSVLTGIAPLSPVAEGSDGLLYGMTYIGGSNNLGTVFKGCKDGSSCVTLLNLTDGSFPQGGLVLGSNGVIFGTTSSGGTNGFGTLFKLDTNGNNISILHSFNSSSADGKRPSGQLVLGLDGAIYGTTQNGGTNELGTVYKIKQDGSGYSVLHLFMGTNTDGSYPYGGLAQGKDGNLYGTTPMGGSNNLGTVFKLNTNGGSYTVLRHFGGAANGFDGSTPYAALTRGPDGFLYGTTYVGGSNSFGTVFKVRTNGNNYAILYHFKGPSNGNDGNNPYGGLALGTNGVLYGTTSSGGSGALGTVFRVDTNGANYSILHNFADGSDGNQPMTAVLIASDGGLYGATYWGGGNNHGILFRLFAHSPQVFITSISIDDAGALLDLEGGAAGQSYSIQATTDVTLPQSWQVIGSSVADIEGKFQFLDVDATNRPMRFYRSSLP